MALSASESEFLSRLAAQGKTIFSSTDAQEIWESSTPVDLALHRLEKKGWPQRLERGVYLIIPLEAGPDRTWSESQLVIAPYLIEPAAVAYWSALHYWHMTEQIPRVTFVQSTERKRPVEIQGMRFQFVNIKKERFFSLLERTLNGKKFNFTDRAKTLLDCADRPDLGGGIVQLARALETAETDIEWPKLDRYLARWGRNGSEAIRLSGGEIRSTHSAERRTAREVAEDAHSRCFLDGTWCRRGGSNRHTLAAAR